MPECATKERELWVVVIRNEDADETLLYQFEGTAQEAARALMNCILEDQDGKMQVIVTFLAVLELMKLGKIRAVQTETFGDIEIESLEDENDTTLVGDSYTEDL